MSLVRSAVWLTLACCWSCTDRKVVGYNCFTDVCDAASVVPACDAAGGCSIPPPATAGLCSDATPCVADAGRPMIPVGVSDAGCRGTGCSSATAVDAGRAEPDHDVNCSAGACEHMCDDNACDAGDCFGDQCGDRCDIADCLAQMMCNDECEHKH